MKDNAPQKEHLSEKKGRLPATNRVPEDQIPQFRLTKRDKEIIKAVYTHRALTTPQINALLFSSSADPIYSSPISSRCRKRLKLLYHAGFLYRDEQPTKLMEGRKPLVHFIDEKAVPVLAEELGVFPEDIDWKPSYNDVSYWSFLDHLLSTNDVRVAVEAAAMANDLTVETWLDDRTLKSKVAKDSVTIPTKTGGEVTETIVPDGYFCLTDGEYNYHHFLEVDMGTETRQRFSRKVKRYLAYYSSGRYQEKYNTSSMRVLTVTTGRRRMANLKEVTEKIGGTHEFWFSTFEDVTPGSVLSKPIWQIAGYEGFYSFFDSRLFGED